MKEHGREQKEYKLDGYFVGQIILLVSFNLFLIYLIMSNLSRNYLLYQNLKLNQFYI